MLNISNINTLPIAFYILKDGIITDCNAFTLEMFGYHDQSEIIGKSPADLSPNYQNDMVSSQLASVNYLETAISNSHKTFTWLHMRKNGTVFNANVNLLYVDGYHYAMVTDLDNLTHIKQRIEKSEQMNQLLFNHHKSIILIVNPITKKIEQANDAAISFYGYTYPELVQMSLDDLAEDSSSEPLTLEDRNYFIMQHRLNNGQVKEVEIHSHPITISNQTFLFFIIYDISNQVNRALIFNNVFEYSPNAIAILDKNKKVVQINDQFSKLFHYTNEELLGKSLVDYINPFKSSQVLNDNLSQVFSGRVVKLLSVRKRKDESLVDVEVFGYPVIFNQYVIGAYINYYDVTERVQYQERLELLKKVLENNSEGIIITDDQIQIEWVNKTFTDITKYKLNDVLNRNPKFLQSNLQSKDFYKRMWKDIYTKGKWSGEIWNKNKDGEVYPEWLSIYVIRNKENDITNYVGIFKDLSEMKLIDQKMRILSQKDALTGAFTRVYFQEKLDSIIETYQHKNESFAILFIDLDNFKEINDSLGHHIGDEALVNFANCLIDTFPKDAIISRYGGDEFVLFVPLIDSPEDIKLHYKALIKRLQTPFHIDHNHIFIYCSIGVALFPKDGETTQQLLQHADIAMYQSKNNPETKLHFFTSQMKQEIEEKYRLVRLLRDSLSQNQYEIEYQPIYDQNHQITQAEAMIKWDHVILKELDTKEYLTFIEDNRQILLFGMKLVEDIFIDIKEHDLQVPISINLALSLFVNHNFIVYVKDLMKQYGIQSNQFMIELVTTNKAITSENVKENIRRLTDLGVQITLDDFGNQNSSLRQIIEYRINYIKLNKYFLENFKLDSTNYQIVKSLFLMSLALEVEVIVNGIDTKEQMELLREIGCRYYQGNYLFPSVPIKKLIT